MLLPHPSHLSLLSSSVCVASHCQAYDVDCSARLVYCRGYNGHEFTVPYDHLVLAVGAKNNTFGVDGADEYTYFLKSAAHSTKRTHHTADHNNNHAQMTGSRSDIHSSHRSLCNAACCAVSVADRAIHHSHSRLESPSTSDRWTRETKLCPVERLESSRVIGCPASPHLICSLLCKSDCAVGRLSGSSTAALGYSLSLAAHSTYLDCCVWFLCLLCCL